MSRLELLSRLSLQTAKLEAIAGRESGGQGDWANRASPWWTHIWRLAIRILSVLMGRRTCGELKVAYERLKGLVEEAGDQLTTEERKAMENTLLDVEVELQTSCPAVFWP